MRMNISEELKRNQKDRIWFINKWAEYIMTHSDKEWSKQQNVLINSLVQNGKHSLIDVKTYLRIKKEVCKR